MCPFISEFLGELERSEARLLNWGVVDGCWEKEELKDFAEAFLDRTDGWDAYSQPGDLIDALGDQGLLFHWEESGQDHYRTRCAESIRMLARLRQLFPKHLNQPNAWQTAPTLVADYRLLLRSRKYPLRDREAQEVVELCFDPDLQLSLSSFKRTS